jgi:hypothetical protein
MERYRVLEGLPPYGPMATPIPPEWGRLGRQGLVVEFAASQDDRWTANFQPGLAGLNEVLTHPNQRDVLVFSAGDAWSVDPVSRETSLVAVAIDACWTVADGLVLSRQSLAFLRLGASGVVWHTRRLSWDGFDDVTLDGRQLTALAWSPLTESWSPCSVDLHTGASHGGTYSHDDVEGWQRLATAG